MVLLARPFRNLPSSGTLRSCVLSKRGPILAGGSFLVSAMVTGALLEFGS
jgi:hypothetical protein